jgi:hypothetical protein
MQIPHPIRPNMGNCFDLRVFRFFSIVPCAGDSRLTVKPLDMDLGEAKETDAFSLL